MFFFFFFFSVARGRGRGRGGGGGGGRGRGGGGDVWGTGVLGELVIRGIERGSFVRFKKRVIVSITFTIR